MLGRIKTPDTNIKHTLICPRKATSYHSFIITISQWISLALEGGRKGALKVSPDHAKEIIAIFKKYGTE